MNQPWFRFLAQAAPWLTLFVTLAMFWFLHDRLPLEMSVTVDLPETNAADAAVPGLVALLLPGDAEGTTETDSIVFFDDARYVLSDPASVDDLARRLGERAVETKCGTLLLLADRRVSAGDVMRVMSIAKAQRFARVQLAEKHD